VLQGTFDTLSLTEVLALLAQSQKTGALWLEAASAEGRVYLADGRCCAAESTELTDPVTTDAELGRRLVDVCFSLARQQEGSFRFEVDAEPTWRVSPAVEIDDAVDALGALLDEWREIQAVIPSLDVRPRLAAELGTDSIIVDQLRWRLLVRLDGQRSVRDVMHETQRSVMDVCNALKELIEEGAVEVEPTTPAYDAEPAAPVEPEMAVDAVPMPAGVAADEAGFTYSELPPPPGGASTAHLGYDAPADADALPALAPYTGEGVAAAADEYAPVDEAAPVDEQALAAVAAEQGVDPRDRGALLRLFSALRDT
jgi:hypothetical protein